MKNIYANTWRITICLIVTLLSLPAQATKITKPNETGPLPEMQVNTFTGNFFYQRPDLYIPGRGPSIDVTFYYNSGRTQHDWGYGHGWSFTYSMQYYFSNDTIVIERGDGNKDAFAWDGIDFYSPVGVYDQLTEYLPGQYLLTTKHGMEYFFDDPTHQKITSVVDRNGNTLTLSYTEGELTTITDASGRQINLSWADGHLAEITDPNTSPNRVFSFQYNQSWFMTEFTNEAGNTISYEYGDWGNITAITDARSNTFNISYNENKAVEEMSSGEKGTSKTFDYSTYGATAVTQMVSSVPLTTIYSFDETDRVNSVQYPDLSFVSYTWDDYNNIETYIDEKEYITSFIYDDRGNMLSMTDCLENTEYYTYEDVYNQMLSFTDKNGFSTAYAYDENGNLLSEADALGHAETYAYDPAGNMVSLTDRNNFTTTFVYDDHGNVVSQTDPLEQTETFTYDELGNLISHTNKIGFTGTNEYDVSNQRILHTDPLGNETTYEYDENGNLISETDPLECKTDYEYDPLNSLVERISGMGTVKTYEYDEAGNVISETDDNDHTTNYGYDARGRLISSTDCAENTEEYGYDAAGNRTSHTDKNDNTTEYEYDCQGRLIRVSDPDANTEEYEYDPLGNTTKITDKNGNPTSYEYDEMGRLVKQTDPLENSEEYEYDPAGQTTSTTDKNGNTTDYEYDGNGRLVRVTDPQGNSEDYEYDPLGNRTRITDKNEHSTEYEYDGNGRLIRVTDELEYIEEYEYDAAGNRISKIDKNGNTTDYEYDCLGRLIKVTDDLEYMEEFEYDAMGNRISHSDKGGNTTDYEYDCMSRLVKVTDPLENSEEYEYDPLGNRTRIIDKKGNPTSYEYDKMGRLVRTTDPLENTEEYEYDPLGNRTGITDKNGNPTSYEYDKMGRLVRETDPLGNREEHGYDAAGNRISFTDKNGHTTLWVYDCCRLISKSNPLGATESYAYDAAGNRISISDANGHTTDYEYDELDRLIKVTTPMGNETEFTYDGVGNTLSRTDANNHTTTYEYDALGRLSSTSYPDETGVSNQYDSRGNLTQSTNTGGIGDVITHQYDALGRLISTETDYGDFTKTVSYGYDNAGNRTSLTSPEGTITWEYDELGRISSVTDQHEGQTDFTYDNVGNRLSMSYPDLVTSISAYDAENRLTYHNTYSMFGNLIQGFSYEYDAAGNKTSVTSETGKYTSYTYDDANRLISESAILPEYCIPYANCTYGDGLDDFELVGIFNNNSGCSIDGYGDFTDMFTGLMPGTTYDLHLSSAYENQLVCLWIDFNGNHIFEDDERLLTDVELETANVLYTFELSIPYGVPDITTRMRVRAHWLNSAMDPCGDFYYGETEDYTVIIGDGGEVPAESTTHYTYDPVGNRLSTEENGIVSAYNYNDDDMLLSAGTVSFGNDNNGNRTSKIDGSETTTYTFDYENRLTHINLPYSGYLSYSYSAEGKQLAKDDNGWARHYVYGGPFVIEEIIDEGTYTMASYNPGISIWQEEMIGCYHGDGFGSTTLLTGQGNEIIANAEFDYFGNILRAAGWWMNDRIVYQEMGFEQGTGLLMDESGTSRDPETEPLKKRKHKHIVLSDEKIFEKRIKGHCCCAESVKIEGKKRKKKKGHVIIKGDGYGHDITVTVNVILKKWDKKTGEDCTYLLKKKTTESRKFKGNNKPKVNNKPEWSKLDFKRTSGKPNWEDYVPDNAKITFTGKSVFPSPKKDPPKNLQNYYKETYFAVWVISAPGCPCGDNKDARACAYQKLTRNNKKKARTSPSDYQFKQLKTKTSKELNKLKKDDKYPSEW